MFKDRRPPADLQASIDETRRWLAAPSVHSRSGVERRGDERRALDRRGHTNTARRAEDAERNQHRRALLLSFFSTLSYDDLLLWIDRLWLRHATEPQLDALVASVRESPHFAERIANSHVFARVRATDPPTARPNDPWLSAEWRNLSEQLAVLASLRRQHHAVGHHKRNGTPKSSQYRDAGLASPIGARIAGAGLFDEFFDRPELTPEEMAAQLLQREVEIQLRRFETSTPRSRRRFGSFTAAAAAVTAVALVRGWRSLYRELRDRVPQPAPRPAADAALPEQSDAPRPHRQSSRM